MSARNNWLDCCDELADGVGDIARRRRRYRGETIARSKAVKPVRKCSNPAINLLQVGIHITEVEKGDKRDH